ncbi:response regulator transcription factor [Mariniflexile fucanivorans]|uniref:response regulator transcription factor n=1 Tax=Mariniflexile fucanivorans TaxID=264023 RepID=UPI00140470F6
MTRRETQILQLISEGNTSEQIASILNISKHTVDTHRQNIIKKNNIKNTSAILKNF